MGNTFGGAGGFGGAGPNASVPMTMVATINTKMLVLTVFMKSSVSTARTGDSCLFSVVRCDCRAQRSERAKKKGSRDERCQYAAAFMSI